MSRTHLWTWVVLVCLVCAAGVFAQQDQTASDGNAANSSAVAAVPRLIKFSGMLKDLTGKPLTGPVDVNFAIYKEQADLVPLWYEAQTLQLDEQGRYTVLLGAMQAEGLPMALFTSGEARWLEVYVPGAESQPRTLLVSVPYALKAGDAETLGGKPASAFMPVSAESGAGQSVTTAVIADTALPASTLQSPAGGTAPQVVSGTPGHIAKFTSTEDLGDSAVFESGGNVGIGTASPESKLQINTAKQTIDGIHILGSDDHFADLHASLGNAYYNNIVQAGDAGIIFSDGSPDTGNFVIAPWAWATSGLRMASTGNVGIGTTAPGEKLEVAGNVKASGSVTATSFSGDGSGLTNLNADMLDGTHASSLATLGTNLFVGNQSVTGNLNLTGSINDGLRIELTTDTPNIIGGFSGNSVTSGVAAATISGGGGVGGPNRITDVVGTIAGGVDNQAGDDAGTLDDACCATVGGGVNNKAKGGGSTIGGGVNNVAPGPGWTTATIGGGDGNVASGWADTVAGGSVNTASGTASNVSGGTANLASGWVSAIGGGLNNKATGNWDTVPGGDSNEASGGRSFAAGFRAKAVDYGSFVWGDSTEADVTSLGWNSFVVRATGGAFFSHNLTAGGIVSAPAFFGDGSGLTGVPRLVGGNSFFDSQSISGSLSLTGSINNAFRLEETAGSPNVLGGHTANVVTSGVQGATIAGGGGGSGVWNEVTDDWGTVGGGSHNRAGDGAGETWDRFYATVGGGTGNTASGQYATVGGGNSNTASNVEATVGGGKENIADAGGATVGGGANNTASGNSSTVPGGHKDTAQGNYSFAAGYRAKALHGGTFVWGDSTDADIESTGDHQFVVRATGGSRFITSVDGAGNPQNTVSFEGGTGNITAPGSVSAASFTGDGSGLTNVPAGTASDLECSGCVGPPEVSFSYAGSDSQGGPATSALTAAEATNALNLGGVASYARLDVGNSFTGDQAVSLSATGLVSVVKSAGPGAAVAVSSSADGNPTLRSVNHAVGGWAISGEVDATTGRGTGVRGEISTPEGDAMVGEATAASGQTVGVYGASNSTGGYGVAGDERAESGNTIGVIGTAHSPDGTAGVFYNVAGGRILRGVAGDPATEVFRVEGSGNIYAAGGLSVDSGTFVVDATNHRVGIGTVTPGNILTVVQDSDTDPIADSWTTYSSRRWKTDIQTLGKALERVRRLRGVSFNWKRDGQHDIGLIAEEVGEVVPEVVAYEENGVDAKSVDYARLTALLIEAVKEQQVQIKELRVEVERLNAKLNGGVEVATR